MKYEIHRDGELIATIYKRGVDATYAYDFWRSIIDRPENVGREVRLTRCGRNVASWNRSVAVALPCMSDARH